jgi:hypothetical protein
MATRQFDERIIRAAPGMKSHLPKLSISLLLLRMLSVPTPQPPRKTTSKLMA